MSWVHTTRWMEQQYKMSGTTLKDEWNNTTICVESTLQEAEWSPHYKMSGVHTTRWVEQHYNMGGVHTKRWVEPLQDEWNPHYKMSETTLQYE